MGAPHGRVTERGGRKGPAEREGTPPVPCPHRTAGLRLSGRSRRQDSAGGGECPRLRTGAREEAPVRPLAASVWHRCVCSGRKRHGGRRQPFPFPESHRLPCGGRRHRAWSGPLESFRGPNVRAGPGAGAVSLAHWVPLVGRKRALGPPGCRLAWDRPRLPVRSPELYKQTHPGLHSPRPACPLAGVGMLHWTTSLSAE